MSTPINRPTFTAQEATHAVKARIGGRFNDPVLKRFGPLGNLTSDITAILDCVPEEATDPVPTPHNDEVTVPRYAINIRMVFPDEIETHEQVEARLHDILDDAVEDTRLLGWGYLYVDGSWDGGELIDLPVDFQNDRDIVPGHDVLSSVMQSPSAAPAAPSDQEKALSRLSAVVYADDHALQDEDFYRLVANRLYAKIGRDVVHLSSKEDPSGRMSVSDLVRELSAKGMLDAPLVQQGSPGMFYPVYERDFELSLHTFHAATPARDFYTRFLSGDTGTLFTGFVVR